MTHAVLYRPNYETFDPEDHALYNLPADYSRPITRAQAAAIVSRLAAALDKPMPEGSPAFTDVPAGH